MGNLYFEPFLYNSKVDQILGLLLSKKSVKYIFRKLIWSPCSRFRIRPEAPLSIMNYSDENELKMEEIVSTVSRRAQSDQKCFEKWPKCSKNYVKHSP
jgi:hypothetical protein